MNMRMMAELRNMDIAADPEGALQCFLYYMQLRENSYMSIESGSETGRCLREVSCPCPRAWAMRA